MAQAYHTTPNFSSDDYDPPDRSYEEAREIAARAFPSFGFYADVTPEPISAPDVIVGDAIDDLADIAVELQEVEWRWTNTSPEDAAWAFRFGYQSHWGKHLHNLRRYLHDRQFRS